MILNAICVAGGTIENLLLHILARSPGENCNARVF